MLIASKLMEFRKITYLLARLNMSFELAIMPGFSNTEITRIIKPGY